MKHNLLVLHISILAILFSVQNVMAKQKKPKYYKIKTELMNGNIIKGYLYKVDNRSVHVLANQYSMHIDSIKGEEIKRIVIRRKGKVGRSMGIAAAAGAVALGVPFAIAYTPCPGGCWMSPNSALEEGVWAGITGALAGVIIGGITGIFNNSSERINGNMATYLRYVPEIKKFALQP